MKTASYKNMSWRDALGVLMGVRGDGSLEETDAARALVTRAVANVLGIADCDGALSDWIANGEYCGIETPSMLANEYRNRRR
jgi:hypothetical protein